MKALKAMLRAINRWFNYETQGSELHAKNRYSNQYVYPKKV